MQNVTKTQKQKIKIISFTKKRSLCLIGGKQPNNTILPFFFHWNPYSTPYSNSFIQITTFIVWDQNECNSTRIINRVYATPSKGFKTYLEMEIHSSLPYSHANNIHMD
jgi:hypothetical protein